jgi:ParB-like chromosome segregation protein Spo0J
MMSKLTPSLSELSGNPKNPRRISDKKLEMLKKALAEFGDLSGIVFNRKSHQLVGGHQRVMVLPKEAKISLTKNYEQPTRTGTLAEGFVEIDGERFSYREVDWDDSKEKAANIAANKGAGDWDFSQLSEWMLELDSLNFDMDLTMFDEEEIERLMGGWDSGTESVENTEENLDGITATIKIKCPQELVDEVTIYLKAKLLETSFTGVELV